MNSLFFVCYRSGTFLTGNSVEAQPDPQEPEGLEQREDFEDDILIDEDGNILRHIKRMAERKAVGV